jgi:hypothetical protein
VLKVKIVAILLIGIYVSAHFNDCQGRIAIFVSHFDELKDLKSPYNDGECLRHNIMYFTFQFGRMSAQE